MPTAQTEKRSLWFRILNRVATGIGYLSLVALTFAVLGALGVYLWAELQALNNHPQFTAIGERFEPAVAEEIQSSTADIEFDLGRARAFLLPGTDVLLTNHHVVEAACSNWECDLKVRRHFESDEQRRTRFTGTRYRVHRCVSWLDICALIPYFSEVPQMDLTRLKGVPDKGTALFMIGKSNDAPSIAGTVILEGEGEVERSTGAFVTMRLRGKHGYSGSPVFDRNGRLVAVLSQGASMSTADGKGPEIALLLQWVTSLDDDEGYSEGARGVSAEAIKEILFCDLKATGVQGCIDREIAIYLDTVSQLYLSDPSSLYSVLNVESLHRTFITRLCGEIPELHSKDDSATELRRFCLAFHSDGEIGRQQNLERLFAKPIWARLSALSIATAAARLTRYTKLESDPDRLVQSSLEDPFVLEFRDWVLTPFIGGRSDSASNTHVNTEPTYPHADGP